MVEVIKHGYLKHCECAKCGAELRYNISDLEENFYYKNKDKYRELSITCPDCGQLCVRELYATFNDDKYETRVY